MVVGQRAAIACDCVTTARIAQTMRRAGIPLRYVDATFDSFKHPRSGGGVNSVGRAFEIARQYAKDYLPGQDNGGLVLTGTVGTGKTHLAVSILRELVLERGQVGVFVDWRDLLSTVKATFQPGSTQSEAQVLAPILRADVLVLDELGAARTTDWTADIVEQVLNSRYNSSRSTIITTNYPTHSPRTIEAVKTNRPASIYSRSEELEEVTRTETLGDRIGARMMSRVREMCRLVTVQGEDYRVKLRPSVGY